MTQTHVFLVAVAIEGDVTREEAEKALCHTLPRPNIDGAWVGDASDPKRAGVECWWVAEDDRRDGSDNDSAVFVTPGFQQAAYDLLHDREFTPDCNDPRKQQGRTPHFEGPGEATPGIYVTDAPADDPAWQAAYDALPEGTRLPHPDVPCRWCGEFVMDENACPNAKDICNDCCGED